MTGLLGYARTQLRGGDHAPPQLPTFGDEIERFHVVLAALRDDFADDSLTAQITDEQVLQGPLADAMTHAGQLAMLRRLAGKPVPSENFIFWFIGLVTALLTSFYMFRLWYLTFLGERRAGGLEDHGAPVHARSDTKLVLESEHPVHESPWSMLGPLVILAVLSIGGGWIGIERFASYLAPSAGPLSVEAGSASLEWTLAGLAVVAALLGWFIAHRMYSARPETPERLAASMSGSYKLLLHKYWIDELYGAVIVKPILATSRFVLEWIVDVAILGGAAWLLGGIATLGGAILQRWQSGNLRSYAAWLTAGAAVVLLYVLWAYSPASLSAFFNHGAGH